MANTAEKHGELWLVDAPAGSARAAVAAPPKVVRPKDPAHVAVRHHLATHAGALLDQEQRVRADAPDSVHKMRVAARRLRSGLRTFRPLVDPVWAAYLSEELRWLANSLGELRDREVLLARLERDIAALPAWAAKEPAQAHVRAELGRGMDSARTDALAALDSPRYQALVAALLEAAEKPRTTPAAQRSCRRALPPLVGKAFRRLADDCADLRLDPPQVAITAESDEAWHEARITGKKARYAAEAVEPVFGKRATRLAGALTRVTETLGEHQDAAIAADAVVELGKTPDVTSSVALTLGVLHGVQREAVRAARADFVAIWPEVSAKRLRAWL
jgi:CHAD domain-containing protein